MAPLYDSVLEAIRTRPGTSLLDVGCGSGIFLALAAERGATVTGIDAAGPFIELARERLPRADLTVGELESLPYPDASFDVVTGLGTFQFAADPARALSQVARVGRPGARVIIATSGPPERCDAAGYLAAIGKLLPPAASRTPEPFAPSALEGLATRGGLVARERREAVCAWEFPDQPTLLRALTSTRIGVRATASAGEERVCAAVLDAVSPYRTSDGGYRLENVFTYLIATNQRGRLTARKGG